MHPSLFRGAAALVLVLAALVAFAPTAVAMRADTEPPGGQAGYLRYGSTCRNDGSAIDIGGRLKIQEFGKHRVTSFKILWQLYTTEPSHGGIDNWKAKQTHYSPTFPNDEKNHWHVDKIAWEGLNPTHEYWLHAKLIWVRPGPPKNWTHWLPMAYCS